MNTPHTKNPFYTSPPETPAAPAAAGLFSPGLYRPAPAAGVFSPGPPSETLNSNNGQFGFMNWTAERVYDARQAAATANLQRAEIKLSLEAAQRKTPADAATIERLSRDLEIARLLVKMAEINKQLEIVKRESPANAVRIDQLSRNLAAAREQSMAVEAAGFAKAPEMTPAEINAATKAYLASVKPKSGWGGAGCSIQGGRRKATRSKKGCKSRSTRKH